MANVRNYLTLCKTLYDDDNSYCFWNLVAAKYLRWIGKWLEDGSFKANKARIMPNGLVSVEEGIKMLQNGEVHAEKLVYRIADTPNLETLGSN